MPLETFLKLHGINFIVQRSSEPDRTELGLPNHDKETNRAYIGFRPGIDIKVGDKLINPANESVYVTETETDFFRGKPEQLMVYYQTELEHNAENKISNTVFNIQNAYGSVIGNSNQVTIYYDETIKKLKEQVATTESSDKAELEKIIALLEMVVNNQVPPTKGLFSKFRNVMERNSWITGSIANAILSWLLSKTP